MRMNDNENLPYILRPMKMFAPTHRYHVTADGRVELRAISERPGPKSQKSPYDIWYERRKNIFRVWAKLPKLRVKAAVTRSKAGAHTRATIAALISSIEQKKSRNKGRKITPREVIQEWDRRVMHGERLGPVPHRSTVFRHLKTINSSG